MKKTFALIMALALTITCLVGCGSKDAGSEAGGATTQNAYERIMANGYMTVGIDPTIENIIFTEAGESEPTGFIPDISWALPLSGKCWSGPRCWQPSTPAKWISSQLT